MKTIIHIKADAQVKKTAQRVAADLGLSLSAVMNAYLRQFIRSREMHIAAIPHMSRELERLLVDVEHDISKKQNLSPAFSRAEDMDEYLNAL